jgi:hypothetical protein
MSEEDVKFEWAEGSHIPPDTDEEKVKAMYSAVAGVVGELSPFLLVWATGEKDGTLIRTMSNMNKRERINMLIGSVSHEVGKRMTLKELLEYLTMGVDDVKGN